MSASVLLIAIDGADGAMLDRWTADGTLRNLAELRQKGSSTRLSPPEGITDDGIWASFQYASSPGVHGRYYWKQRLRSGEMGMAFRDEEGLESFWETLSDEGYRVAVFDIPKCGEPKPLNGLHLVDWLVHGRYFQSPRSYPASLSGEILERFGPAPPSRCGYETPALEDGEVLEVVQNLRRSIGMKRAAGVRYLESQSWDVFMIGFKEAHCASHHLWDLADPDPSSTTGLRADRLGDPMKTILRDLDTAVGNLISAAGGDAAVVAFTPTDMVQTSSLSHVMPAIVDRVNRELKHKFPRRMVDRLVGRTVAPACQLLPYNENCTAIRLRATPGGSSPGAQAENDELAASVETLLRELSDVDSGRPIVQAVDRPSRRYHGPRAALLPDLLIRFAPGIHPTSVRSSRLGRFEAPRPALRPGDHASGGFLISTPPVIRPIEGVDDVADHVSSLVRRSNTT